MVETLKSTPVVLLRLVVPARVAAAAAAAAAAALCAARTIKYNKLVLAVGAEPASGIDKVPGARERAIPFYSIEDSYRVKQAIIKLKVEETSWLIRVAEVSACP